MTKKKKDPDTHIAYQNKDITAKSFADRLKGKNLGVYGLSQIEVVDVLPTNLPAIEANELRLDNLFKLATGEYAIVDYESEYNEENKVKYIGYVARLSKRMFSECGEFMPLKIIVIYTADVKRGSTDPVINLGDFHGFLTEAFLTGIDSEKIRNELNEKINRKEAFTEEDMMKLVIYPLTLKGKRAKQKAVGEAIDIAEKIEDEKMMIDVMKGILVFSDKVIKDEDARRIKRRFAMTKVERLYEEEKEQAVMEAELKVKKEEKQKAKKRDREIAINLLKAGDSIEKVAKCLGLPKRSVQSLASKM